MEQGFFLLLFLGRFNVHIQSKLLQHTFVVGTSSDLGQPFHPRQKREFRLGKNRSTCLIRSGQDRVFNVHF